MNGTIFGLKTKDKQTHNMLATIDRNVEDALSQSESISRTQQRAQIEIGSDEFLDIVLGLKKSLIQSTNQMGELNASLILTFNKNPTGVLELMPKLKELHHLSVRSINITAEGLVGQCVGRTVLANIKIETDQLGETIYDIEMKSVKPSASLQSLFDQL
ncbi:hypothetical protein [Spirosoma areae]